MKIRKSVASAGNSPPPIIEMEMEMEEEEEEDGKLVDGETESNTTSLPDEEPSSPPNYRRLQEVGRQVEWKWKRRSLQGHRVRMRLSCKKAVLEDIQSVLTDVGGEELTKQFVDGCFGHLMHLVGHTCCLEALHELMSREITLYGALEDELWFHIGGTNIRFSPSEYALITGLRFGSSSFDPLGSHDKPKNGVCKQFFKKGRPISVQELWKKFKTKGLLRGSAEDDDYLKVAHVLALYLMVLGYGEAKVVDQWVWVLAEDLDLWNGFPWGAYSYQALMHYVTLLPKSTAGLGQGYRFLGPGWALLIWGYEAIPDLGNTCAFSTGQVTVPRCCKWLSGSRKINLTNFFNKEHKSSVTLEPTDEEKLQPYWLSLQCTPRLGVEYTPLQRFGRTKGRVRAPLAFDERSSSGERARPVEDSASDSRVFSSRHKDDRPHQEFGEAGFVERVSDKVVERLSQWLIPQMKQLIELRQSPSQPLQPPRKLEMMHDTSFVHAQPPGNYAESDKAAKSEKEKQLNDGGSTSMNISRKADDGRFTGEKTKQVQKDAFGGEEQSEGLDNAPRLDTGVSGGAKSFANRKDAIDQDQIGSSKHLKGEQKRLQRTSPHRKGDEANIAKKKKKKKNKKNKNSRPSKHMRQSPSSSEDEGSESSSDNKRRRKVNKRSKKKKKRKYSESSSSECSSDRDRHRRKRNRHRRHRSSPSDSEASDSVST